MKSLKEIKDKFNSLLSESSEEEGLNHDAYMLMAGYLSEIERIQKKKSINRKELAKEIDISPSYLTQVFRGDKPLNFYTLAKIQRKLKIRFQVAAYELDGYSDKTQTLSSSNLEPTQGHNLPKYSGSTYSISGNRFLEVSSKSLATSIYE